MTDEAPPLITKLALLRVGMREQRIRAVEAIAKDLAGFFHLTYRFEGEQLDDAGKHLFVDFERADLLAAWEDLDRAITYAWAEKHAFRHYLAQGFTEDQIRVGMLAAVEDFAKPQRRRGETDAQFARRPATTWRPAEVTGLIQDETGYVAGVDARLEDAHMNLSPMIVVFRKTIHGFSIAPPAWDAAGPYPGKPLLAGYPWLLTPRALSMDAWHMGGFRIVLGRHPPIKEKLPKGPRRRRRDG